MKMKKALALLAAMSMMMSMVSCGGGENSTPAETTAVSDAATTAAETAAATTAETTAAETTTAAVTTEAAPVIPEGATECVMHNIPFSIDLTFYAPKIDELVLTPDKGEFEKSADAHRSYSYKKGSSQRYSITVQLAPTTADAEQSAHIDKKNAAEVTKQINGYNMYFTRSNNDRKWVKAVFYAGAYLDGSICATVEFAGESGDNLDDLEKYLEETLKYVKVKADDSAFRGDALKHPTLDITMPKKIDFNGGNLDVRQTMIGVGRLEYWGEFPVDGRNYTIHTVDAKKTKTVSGFKGYQDVTIGGLASKAEVSVRSNRLQMYAYVPVSEEMMLGIYVEDDGKGFANSKEAAAQVDDAHLAETTARLVGYANDFFNAMTVSAKLTAAVTTAATTTAAATTTTAAVTTAAQTTAAAQGMSDEVLLVQAKLYYASKYNHQPEGAKIEGKNGEYVTVMLYDIGQDGEKVLERLTIDRTTGKGTSEYSEDSFTITSNQPANEPLWEPANDVYALVPKGKDAAVMYIGAQQKPTETIDVEFVLKHWVEESDLAKKYPFLKDIPEQNVVCTEQGNELWAIIPKNGAGTITVWEYDAMTGTEKYRITETYNSAPIILCCNYSDIASNVAVQIKYLGGGETAKFSPYISMMDGEPAVTQDSIAIVK
ncbi:MAG: hypothetical protein IK130_00270 [Oscillospiraceae bacterium]|nr:hypothetical protein [Oscillospiraceae bacterium]